MKLALTIMTGRADPKIEWITQSLDQQARTGDEIHLIVVNALLAHDASRTIDVGPGRSPSHPWLAGVTHTAPKPNVWQGAQRVTSSDWWATSNARNTALVVCPEGYDYLAFLDDRCRLGPHWLDAVRDAYTKRASVIAGAYVKTEGPADDPLQQVTAKDHRAGLHPSGKINCGGGWLYGCSFALPLAWALEVNGFEEACDGLTGEDYIFGLMLGNRGRRIDYRTDMLVMQDRTRGNESCKGSYRCTDKGVSPNDKSHAALARFGKRDRTDARFTPDLTALRARYQRGEGFPDVDRSIEHRDWYDGQPIREMT